MNVKILKIIDVMSLVSLSAFPGTMIWLSILFHNSHGTYIAPEEINLRISLVTLSCFPSVIGMIWFVPRYLTIMRNKFPNISKATRVVVIPFFAGLLFACGIALLYNLIGRG